ncbi:MAG TPA: lytic transglycosylase domain-containing protein [Bacteroidales bacterium]|nr:lytic transglycosylase domain-containing protein [Bacteroidales bacterium]
MSKRFIFIFLLVAFAAFEGFYYTRNLQKSATDVEYQKAFLHSNKIFSLVLPDKAEFAGEEAPLGLYYVREGLDRELMVNTYWHSSTLLMLKKSNRYFHIIIPILKKHNIPEDFKYLALIESGLTNIQSQAGAAGFWQIVPGTAKNFGLEITDQVDERYHIEKATEAACKLLRGSYNKFGSWTLAAAAYNVGEGRISRELERQSASSYYDLYLPEETMRYVYRIIALKLLYEHPTEYGYFIRKKDLYPPIPTYTVSVDSSISNLPVFARTMKINYRLLKEFNPWLRSDKLTNTGKKKYMITLPKKGFEDFDRLLDEIENAEQIFNDTITTGMLPR